MGEPALSIHRTPYDVPAVQTLVERVQDYYRSLYRGPDPSPTDTDHFSPPGGAFFLGQAGETPVAIGGWRFVEAVDGYPARRPAEIKRMWVEPDYRGSGFARRLLAHLERTAADAGADAVILSTGRIQVDAVALYRSAGYTDIPPFGFFAPYPTVVHLGKPVGVSHQVSELRAAGTGR